MIDPTFHAPPVDPDHAALEATGMAVAAALLDFINDASGTEIAVSLGKVTVVRGDVDGLRLDVTVVAGPDVIEGVRKEIK